ncbi:hypothetical protein HSX10_11845 [Winogradskyella undariae]|uniref:hypothetical protein n=1 Tax=Winogradskyella undariae TaxID=1285465 RepID=UPI00156A7CA9|nr:hypothetical protein [Winogradskyella undariae]NRR92261.1 hypothetical protein [Winogradskyella undariae]
MNKSKYIIIFTMLFGVYSYSQTNSLTGSPYSLFGLGVENNSNAGRNSGLGKTGISLDADYGINLYNPASFISLKENEITFDFGGSVEFINLTADDLDEQNTTYNFTNISLAFNRNNNYGIGLTLKPATTVGYSLTGLENNIEGSEEEFTSNIIGTGGLSEIRLDYARTYFKDFNIGVKASYLFGKIDETESIITSNSYLEINESNYYSGAQLGLGLQYNLLDKHNFGLIVDLPTVLKGSKDVVIGKYSNAAYSILEETEDESIDSFYLPLKIGFGYSTKFKNLLLTADYNINFWSSTDQSDAIGDYTDQNIFSLGASYAKDPTSYKYWDRVDFRMGLNYNSGYLKIDGTNIDSYTGSLGIGLPLGRRSLLNISYALSKKGTTESILIQEYVNTININLSLSDLWFQKRKFN